MIAIRDESTFGGSCPTPMDLIQDIIALNDEVGSANRFGSFSGTVYDTAWLSMIMKPEHGQIRPLFPECFEYILESQLDGEGWGATGSQIDGILNSLAALLALISRQRSHSTESQSHFLQGRIEKGCVAVQKLLQNWNVKQSVHVGFEILVPSILRQLEAFGLQFDFPGYSVLMQLNQQKLKKFKPAFVYSPVATTLLHSLEAFVGLVDFDKVGHHCTEESGMFGSPSSTAAYLINRSSWDDRAERYLKMVISATGGNGLVPSAYPTCLFEISWALSTLLTPRIIQEQLTDIEKGKLSHLVGKALDQQNGVVGFAPGVLEDADDTARCLMTLQCLGQSPSPDRLIETFQTDNHFRTYRLEGSPSFSANCNVLLALLGCHQLDKYQQHIEKALTFLLDLEESGPVSDKWNLSSQYTRMLFMQALVCLLGKFDTGLLKISSPNVIAQRVPSCICRLLDQTLSTQASNGSWDDSLEVTAYGIITLIYCLSMPWSLGLKAQLNESISRGREYLCSEYGTTTKNDYLWIEKVSYRSSLLHLVYCSAALNIKALEYKWSSTISERFSLRNGTLKHTSYLISSLPMFQLSKIQHLELLLVEAQLITARLRESRNALFERNSLPMTSDKYLDFIPMIWVLCNHKNGRQLSANTLWEMVLISLFNFQVDEYMESVVAKIPEAELTLLMDYLRSKTNKPSEQAITLDGASTLKHQTTNLESRFTNASDESDDGMKFYSESSMTMAALQVLGRFLQHIVQHWSVRRASTSVQREMSTEVLKFVAAHNSHNQDNLSLGRSKTDSANNRMQQWRNNNEYIDWARSTASDDTSCPFSFLFFSCLISEPDQDCFENAQARYFSKSLCRHLATMCRQYNDYGSAKRDAEEGNLNSLDFPEFKNCVSTSAKEDLMAIAEFERSCMEVAKDNLGRVVSVSMMRKLQVFIDVTDMFGQVYVQRDIASRVKNSR